MAEAKPVRLVSRWTGSVISVPQEKAAALATLGFFPEKQPAAKKK